MNRRRWLLAATCGATLGWHAFGERDARAAALATETRPVAGFDAVRWEGGGELTIEQTGRERLSIEAEPAVLALVVAEVRQGRLRIGFAPGRRVVTEQPVRFRLEVRTLTALELQGAGNARLGPLDTPSLALTLGGSNDLRLDALRARSLDARLNGAGVVVIGRGRVEHQRVVIGGACQYDAVGLDSERAELAIDGGGDIRLSASRHLVARIGGSGRVLYRGQPQVERTITGAGEVRRDDKD